MSPNTTLGNQRQPDGAPEMRWRNFRLGDKLRLVNGAAFKPTDWTSDGLPIVRIQNLNNPAAPYNHYAGQRPDKFKLYGGELLFAWSGTPGTSFGAHVWRGAEAWLNQHIFKVLFDDTEWDKRFLQFAINQNLDQYIRAAHGGAGLAHITKGRFEDSELPCPALADQREIVAEIEKQFTRLDAGASALRRVQANLKRYRAGVLKAACEGRLVPTEAELARQEVRSYETGAQLLSRIIVERSKGGRGQRSDSKKTAPAPTRLGALPAGWAYPSIGTVGFVQLGRQRSPKDHNGPHMRPYLRVANVYEDHLDLTDVKTMNFSPSEFKVFQLLPNDILLNEGQSLEWVGRPAIYRGEIPGACFQNTLVRFRPCGSLNPRFALTVFRAFMHDGRFQKIAKWTTNIAHLGGTRFAELGFPLPPLAEQNRIVTEVERLLTIAQATEAVISTVLQRAANLRQSVLHQAFTGQLLTDRPKAPTASVQLADARRPNRHFARALLSAEIVHQLHNQPTFGRVKHQKIIHLCEHIAQIRELEGQYHREAAGPLDNKMIFANEGELKKQKWYTTVARKGYGHAYQPMSKAGGHRVYFERYWPEKLATVERLIELMRKWDTDACEIFSTAYAAWNDLLIWRKEATEEAILNEILNRWNPEKRRFKVERWRGVIDWMKAEGFAPSGFGRPTCLPE